MLSISHTSLKVSSYYNSFTKTEKKVADFVLENTNDVMYYSITELADKASVGESTVLRFSRKLGFSGFQDFKLSVAQDQIQPSNYEDEEVQQHDQMKSVINKVIKKQINSLEGNLQLLDDQSIQKAVNIILQSKKVTFFGVGSSGITASQASSSMLRIGINCDYKYDSHFQAMSASLLTAEDCVVGISVSGSTKDTIYNVEIAKKAGAKIICITNNAKSPITKLADIVLLISGKENPLEGSSVLSQLAQLSCVDILCTAIKNQRNNKTKVFSELTAKALSEKLY